MKVLEGINGQTKTCIPLFQETFRSGALEPTNRRLFSDWHLKSSSEECAEGIVVVIDDESSVVELMECFLKLYGITVKGFTDPCEAIDWHEEHWRDVELVFLDMCSPVMNGEDCFPILRSMDPNLPIVLMSGGVDSEIVDELIAQGALCFFPKPFHFPSIAAWVLHRLGRPMPEVTNGNTS